MRFQTENKIKVFINRDLDFSFVNSRNDELLFLLNKNRFEIVDTIEEAEIIPLTYHSWDTPENNEINLSKQCHYIKKYNLKEKYLIVLINSHIYDGECDNNDIIFKRFMKDILYYHILILEL
jgi:hypothetical protein